MTDSLAAGFQAAQAGGALGPDRLERGIKDIFTKQQAPTQKSVKEPAAAKTKQSANMIVNSNSIPNMAAYRDLKTKMLFTYDDQQNKWVSRDGKIELSAKDGSTGFNSAREKSKLESKDRNMKKVNEDLAELAGVAEKDHEVQMARADLYKIAKYAIKLHEMLKGVSESQGLEGWQQAKITKAADYVSSVYHNLDYDMKFKEQLPQAQLQLSDIKKESTDPYKKKMAERLAKKIA